MSSEISDVAEGLTKGLLNWSVEKVDSFIQKLREKKLAFIEEPKTIEIVREQYKSGEAEFYKKYIKNKDILFLVRMGLTLRKLENEEERRLNLRDKLFKKYKLKGLHIAEFVQNGILNRYIGILLEELTSIETLEKEIEEILINIEKYTLFVQGTVKKSEVIKNVDIKVSSNSPHIFIVSGVKSAAKIVREIIEPLKEIKRL